MCFRIFVGALTVLLPEYSATQEWFEYVSPTDRFGVNFPNKPEIQELTYNSEYDRHFPARVYTALDEESPYSVTVVDFRDAQQIHDEGSIRWLYDQRASVARAARQFREQAANVTWDAWGHVEHVEGHQLQMTNPDGSRSFVGIYFHGQVGYLYILEATVPSTAPPPGQFQNSLNFLDEEGGRVRYRLEPDGSTTRIIYSVDPQ